MIEGGEDSIEVILIPEALWEFNPLAPVRGK